MSSCSEDEVVTLLTLSDATGAESARYRHPSKSTLTPLNRPAELADKATLTAQEVAEWEQFELRRQNRDLIIDSVGGAGYPPGVISYKNFWHERGTNADGTPLETQGTVAADE
ncbi:MAG: hypothetical protein WDZ52_03605 [Pseudohongiellaceae bacterium]